MASLRFRRAFAALAVAFVCLAAPFAGSANAILSVISQPVTGLAIGSSNGWGGTTNYDVSPAINSTVNLIAPATDPAGYAFLKWTINNVDQTAGQKDVSFVIPGGSNSAAYAYYGLSPALFSWNAQVVSVQGNNPTGTFKFVYGGTTATTSGNSSTGWQSITPAAVQTWLAAVPNVFLRAYPISTVMNVTNSGNTLVDETVVQVQISFDGGNTVSYSYNAHLFDKALAFEVYLDALNNTRVASARDYNTRYWPTFQTNSLSASQRARKFRIADYFTTGDADRAAWQDAINNLASVGENVICSGGYAWNGTSAYRVMLNNAGVTRTSATATGRIGELFDYQGGQPNLNSWAAGSWALNAAAGYAPEDIVEVQLTDEPGWDFPATYTDLQGHSTGMTEFQNYVASHIEAPLTQADILSAFGWTAWSQVQPEGRSAVSVSNPTLAQEQLFYWTQRFFDYNASSLLGAVQTAWYNNGFWNKMEIYTDTGASNARLFTPGNGKPAGDDSAWGQYDSIELGRLGSSTLFAESYIQDGVAWEWDFECAKMRAGAQHNPSANATFDGYLVGLATGAVPNAFVQKGLAQVGQGGKGIYYYTMGPNYLGPGNGYSDSPYFASVVSQISQIDTMIAKAENVLWPGKMQPAKVAILWPRSSEMWDEKTYMPAPGDILDYNGSYYSSVPDYFADAFGLYLALMNAGVPVDLVDEDDVVNVPSQYKVIYVTEPDIPWQSQQGLLNFMNAGGILVTDTAAGQADRYDNPTGYNMSMYGLATAGIYEAQRQRVIAVGATVGSGTGTLGNFTAYAAMGSGLVYPGNATVLASWTSGGSGAAIVQAPSGSGYHVHFTWLPGYSYLESGTYPSGSLPYGFSSAMRAMVTYPVLTLANITPPVTSNSTLLEMPLLISTNPQGAAVTVINWDGSAQSKTNVQLQIRLPFVAGSVSSVTLGSLSFTQTGGNPNTVTCTLSSLGAGDIVTVMAGLPQQMALNVQSTPPTGVAITSTTGDGGTTNYPVSAINYGASVNLQAPTTDPGSYTFQNWTVNGVNQSSGQKNITFTATGGGFIYDHQWGGAGSGNGLFNAPKGIALDGAGNAYVTDANNSRVQVFTTAGAYGSQWGSSGTGNSQFNTPAGIAVDGSGNVYVADWGNNRVQKFTTTGAYESQWGSAGTGAGQFSNGPWGLAADDLVSVYVTDNGLNRAQKFAGSGTYRTNWGISGTGNGNFNQPGGVTADLSGNVYVADTGNSRIQKFDASGNFVTKWSSWTNARGQIEAFNSPAGVAADALGNVYVVDAGNCRVVEFTPTGGFVTEFGSAGSGNGQFGSGASGIAVDLSGYVYVVDGGNNRVEVFAPAVIAVAVYAAPNTYVLNVQSTAPVGLAIGSTTGHAGTTDYQISSVTSGTSVNLSAPATDPTGYAFSRWTLNGTNQTAGVKNLTFSMPGSAATAVAVYTTNTYALTVQATTPVYITSAAGFGGTTNYTAPAVAYGTYVDLTAPASDPYGYIFAQWTLNSTNQSAGQKTLGFTMPAGAVTAVAGYTNNMFTLTVQSTPMTGLAIGSTTGQPGTTNYTVPVVVGGTSVSLSGPVTSPPGYVLAYWTLNGTNFAAGQRNFTFIMPAVATTVVAVYEIAPIQVQVQGPLAGVQFTSSTGHGGTTAAAGTAAPWAGFFEYTCPIADNVACGLPAVTLTAPNVSGYGFVQWWVPQTNQTSISNTDTFTSPPASINFGSFSNYNGASWAQGVAYDPTNNVLYAMDSKDGLVFKHSLTGTLLTSWMGTGITGGGQAFGTNDGNYTLVAVSPDGNYVYATQYNSVPHALIQKYDTIGHFITSWANPNGNGTGFAVGPSGNVYLQYGGNAYVYSSTGTQLASWVPSLAGSGKSWSHGAPIAFDGRGYMYIACGDNNFVAIYTPTGGVTGWTFQTVITAGGGHNLSNPCMIACDANNNLYVTNQGAGGLGVMEFNYSGGVANYVTSFTGTGMTGSFAMTVDSAGNVYTLPPSKPSPIYVAYQGMLVQSQYAPIETLTVQSNPTGLAISGTYPGTTNYTASVLSGTGVTLTAPTVTGYNLSWSLTGTTGTPNGNSITFTMPAGSVTATANYTIGSYTLNVQSSPPTGVGISGTYPGTTNYAATVTYNTSVTLTAPTVSGYTFVQWSLTGTAGTANGNSISFTMPGGDMTAQAQYVIFSTLTVQSTPTGLAISGTYPGTTTYTASNVASGTSITLTAPSVTGYTLSWTVTGTTGTPNGNSISFTMPAQDTTATATYTINSYALTVQSSPPTGVSIGSSAGDAGTTNYATSVVYNSTVDLQAPAADPSGYTFANWTVNGTAQTAGLKEITFPMPAQAMTAVAQYNVNTYTLTVQSTPTSLAITGTYPGTTQYTPTVPYNTSVTLTAPTVNNYLFAGWTLTGATGTTSAWSVSFTMPAGAATAQAKYVQAIQVQVAGPQSGLQFTSSTGHGGTTAAAGSVAPWSSVFEYTCPLSADIAYNTAGVTLTAPGISGHVLSQWWVPQTGATSASTTATFTSPPASTNFGSFHANSSTAEQQWLTYDPVNNLLYAFDSKDGLVFKYSLSGTLMTSWYGTGINGTGTAFYTTGNNAHNTFIALSPDGNYVYTWQYETTFLQKYDSAGNFVTRWNTAAIFSNITGFGVDSSGNIYAEYGNAIYEYNSTGASHTSWSLPYPVGMSSWGHGGPMAFDGKNNMYLSAADGTPNFVMIFQGNGSNWGSSAWTYQTLITSGGGTNLNSPEGIACDANNNLYVSNEAGSNVMEFNYSGGVVTYVTRFSGGAVPVSYAITVDSTGNIYSMPPGNPTKIYVAYQGMLVQAQYALINTYTLTVNDNTPSNGLAIGSTTGDSGTTDYTVPSVTQNSSVNLSAPSTDPTGYTFACWTLNGVNQTAGLKNFTFNMPAQATTAVATYTLNTYMLTVDSSPMTGVVIGSTTGDGGTTDYAAPSVAYNSSVNLSAPSTDPTGYTFEYWTLNGSNLTAAQKNVTFNMPAQATTAVATYTVNTYTLTVQSSPLTGINIGSTTSDGGVTNYTVSNVAYNSSVNLSAPTTDPTGYTFSCWTLNGTNLTAAQKNVTFNMPAQATTAVAQYTINTYALTVQSGPLTGVIIGSTTSDGGTTNYVVNNVTYNSSVNLSAPTTDPTGYTFAYWTLNGVNQTAGVKSLTFNMPAQATTAVATYTLNTYTLTVQSSPLTGVVIGSTTSDGGTTNYAVNNVGYNTSVNLSAPSTDPTGYTFAYWTLNGVNQTGGVKSLTFNMPAQATTAVATYTLNTYTLTVQSTPPTGVIIGSTTSDGGTTNYTVNNVGYNTSVNLSAPSTDPTGYTFAYWTLNGVNLTAAQKNVTFNMPAQATTAVATYTLNTYTLTVQSTPPTGVIIGSTTSDGGTTNYTVNNVGYNTSVNLSAPTTDPTGYTFAYWTLNGVNQTAGVKSLTFNMPAQATTAVATYTLNTYTLTVNDNTASNGLAIGSTTGDGGTTDYAVNNVGYNTSVNLSAPTTDPTGYTFSCWTLNGVNQTAGVKSLTFNMPAQATTAAATYTVNTYTLYAQSYPPASVLIGSTTSDGGTTNYTVNNVQYNSSVNLSAPTTDPSGYTFLFWTLNGVSQTSGVKSLTFNMPAQAATAAAIYSITAGGPIQVQVQGPSSGVQFTSVTGHGGTTAAAGTYAPWTGFYEYTCPTNLNIANSTAGVILTAPTVSGHTFSQWWVPQTGATSSSATATFTSPAASTNFGSFKNYNGSSWNQAVAYDAVNNVLYAFDGEDQVLFRYSLSGTLLTSWAGTGTNGTGTAFATGGNRLYVAPSPDGNYVYTEQYDSSPHCLIQKYDSSGKFYTSWANTENNCMGFAVGPDGYLYCDYGTDLRVYGSTGTLIAEWTPSLTGSGKVWGHGGEIAFDSRGYMYISSGDNNFVAIYTPTGSGTGSAAWNFQTVITAGGGNSLSNPSGLACDANNNLYVSNQGSSTLGVMEFKYSGGVVNYVTKFTGTGIVQSYAMTVDSAGNVYTQPPNYKPTKIYVDYQGMLIQAQYH